MKKMYLRRVLAIAFVAAFMLSFAVPALAAEYVEATKDAKVYPTASTSSSFMGVLPVGAIAEKLGVTGTWTKIAFGKSVGYIPTSDVKSSNGTSSLYGNNSTSSGTTSSSSASSTGNWVKATVPLNVRKGPGTKYSIVGGLATNEAVEKLGTSGKWTKVNYKGTTAYVSSSYVVATTAPSTTTGSSSTGSNTSQSNDLSNRLYAIRRTDIRNGPGSGYTRIGELSAGDYIEYAGTTSGSWYKVQFGSHNAYVYSYDVQFYSGYYGSSTAVYASGTTPVYSSMSSSSTILGYLYTGNSVNRYGSSNSTWTGVLFNGQQGYVYTAYLSSSSSSLGLGNINAYWYATSSSVPCYTTKSSSSTYLRGYLSYGERVWVRYADSTWAECSINGETMYVLVSYLSDDSSYYNAYNSYYNNGYVYTRATTNVYSSEYGSQYTTQLSANTRLTIVSSVNSYGYVKVNWSSGSTYYTGYVRATDIF